MDKKQIINQAIQKGIKQMLDESSVPIAVHKQAIKKLKEIIDGFELQIKELQKELKEGQNSRKDHEKQIEYFNKQIQSYQREVERIRTIMKGDRGEKGERGDDGLSPSVDDIVRKVIGLIPMPKDGKDGVNGKDAEPKDVDTDKIIDDLVELIKKKKLLGIDNINGLREYVGGKRRTADGFNYKGSFYGFEELMHGGGSSSGGSITYSYDLSSQCDGVNKTFTVPSNTNFIQLTGSDAPQIYRPTTDYTGSGTTTLTLTSSVIAPSAGATLILLYVV